MIEIRHPSGHIVRVHEMQRYDPSLDGNAVRISAWYDGAEFWGIAKVEPGRSLREARERIHTALEVAIRSGKPGQVLKGE